MSVTMLPLALNVLKASSSESDSKSMLADIEPELYSMNHSRSVVEFQQVIVQQGLL